MTNEMLEKLDELIAKASEEPDQPIDRQQEAAVLAAIRENLRVWLELKQELEGRVGK